MWHELGSLRVTEVVGAKSEYQSSHTLGKRTIHYLVLQACYYHQIFVDTPHVIDSERVLNPRLMLSARHLVSHSVTAPSLQPLKTTSGDSQSTATASRRP